jgi:cell division protein FtsQ
MISRLRLPRGAGPSRPAAAGGQAAARGQAAAGGQAAEGGQVTGQAGPPAGGGPLATADAPYSAGSASAEFIPARSGSVPAAAAPGLAATEAASAARPKASRRAKRTSDPWRTAFFGVLILAILGGGAWALLGSSLLVVRHEQVTGNRLVPAAQVLAAAGIRRGTPLNSVNTAAAARRVERIARVLSATVTKSWPDTIVISIRERRAELAVASAGRFALVDASGVVFQWARHRPAAIPLLTSPPAQLGGNGGVRAAVSVLRQLPRRLRSLIESVTAPAANAVTFGLRGGITVVWGGPALTPTKAAELIVLLRMKARYYDVSDPSAAVTQQ